VNKDKQKDTALVKAPVSPLAKWKGDLYKEDNLANFAKVLTGTGLSPERFAWQAYSALQRQPKLLEAPPMQLWMGVFAAAECGLSMQPHLQQYHLVPFGNEVTPIIGYQGFSYLVSKAGGGLIEPPVIVFERDIAEGRFKYREGTNRMCRLDPVVKDPKKPKGEVRFVFATYTNGAGVRTFKCMSREEILEHRERSAGWQAFKNGRRKTSPWNITFTKDGSEGGDFLPMCAKTVIRVFSKVLPKSADHWGERAAKAEAVEGALAEGQDNTGDLSGVLDSTVSMETEKTGTEKLKEKVGVRDASAGFTEAEWTPEEPPPGEAYGDKGGS
jgi:recombinational DNA repair protein RecT